MSSGQSLLSLGAVAILSYLALNVNRVYVASVSETGRQQTQFDAINYAQSISDGIYAQSDNYAQINNLFGTFDDASRSSRRLETRTALGDSLFATVTFASEEQVSEGIIGRVATIRVFSKYRGQLTQMVESKATLIKLN
jgi:hypothetical protein